MATPDSPADEGIWMTKDELKDYMRRHIASLGEGDLQHIGIIRQGSLYQILSHEFETVESTQLKVSDPAHVGNNSGYASTSLLSPEAETLTLRMDWAHAGAMIWIQQHS
ncbi:hypothetical protein PG996_012271 [Apiospora saccharicola]|uniref:Uncharacterized protein n=1 Tax=Apiospora saccharicola TaxID=335842 RepID=A0ABR1U4G7_9PEZI